MGKDTDKMLEAIKKNALEICQNIQAKLSLGQFDIYTQAENITSLKDLVKNFLTSKRNHIRASSLKRYQNYLDRFLEYMDNYFPAPSLNVREIKTNYIDESFNFFLENEITRNQNYKKYL